MKKTSLALLGCLGCTIIAVTWWISMPAEGQLLPTNSEQSRASQQQARPTLQPEFQTGCFKLENTAGLDLPKQETSATGCVLRAALSRPKGQVSVTLEKKPRLSLSEALQQHTGILFRQRDPSTYIPFEQPTTVSLSRLKLHSAFSTPTELTGFFSDESSQSVITVSVHSVARVTPEVTTAFWNVVAAIQLE